MQKNLHPQYQQVVIQDSSSDFAVLTRSTRSSTQIVKWTDGKEYPLLTVEVSSASHPFYTGTQQTLKTGDRIDRFQKRYPNFAGN